MNDGLTPQPVTFAQIDAWVRHPIAHELREVPVESLVLGYKAAHMYWTHKPREQRPPDHQADYDRLYASIKANGIQSPLICYTPPAELFTGEGEPPTHVLIGQRRAEIAKMLGIERVMIADVLEDLDGWSPLERDSRLPALVRALGETRY